MDFSSKAGINSAKPDFFESLSMVKNEDSTDRTGATIKNLTVLQNLIE